MKNENEIERLSFDEAYDAATQENIDMIHEQALAENKLFDCTPGKAGE